MRSELTMVWLLGITAVTGCTTNRIAVNATMHGGVAHVNGSVVFIPVSSPDEKKRLSIVLPSDEEMSSKKLKVSVDCLYLNGQRHDLDVAASLKSSRAATCEPMSDGGDPARKIAVAGAEVSIEPGLGPQVVQLTVCIDDCEPESEDRFLRVRLSVPSGPGPTLVDAPPLEQVADPYEAAPRVPQRGQASEEEKQADAENREVRRENECRAAAFGLSQGRLVTIARDSHHVSIARPLARGEDLRVALVTGKKELSRVACLYDDGTQFPAIIQHEDARDAAGKSGSAGARAESNSNADKAWLCPARPLESGRLRLAGVTIQTVAKSRPPGQYASGILCAGECQPWCTTTYSSFEFVQPAIK